MFKGLFSILFWYPEEPSWSWHRPKCAGLITGHPPGTFPLGVVLTAWMRKLLEKNAHFPLQHVGCLTCGMCFLLHQTENWFYQKVTGCLVPLSSSWHFPVWIILNVGWWNPPYSQLPLPSLVVPWIQLPNASMHPAASLPGSWLFRMLWDK